ncbi:hypothetical protein EHYA_09315 [Embleya hyalina]|uniref:Uncharacterized protein n=2 Tax=Embleya hyalina TaxID=516124 RepID=A0A401Z3X4_9ACTN|nr:hypothetical protein EHYA_09315 [Embleya hyalina]
MARLITMLARVRYLLGIAGAMWLVGVTAGTGLRVVLVVLAGLLLGLDAAVDAHRRPARRPAAGPRYVTLPAPRSAAPVGSIPTGGAR